LFINIRKRKVDGSEMDLCPNSLCYGVEVNLRIERLPASQPGGPQPTFDFACIFVFSPTVT
jgi:hypothetical protein